MYCYQLRNMGCPPDIPVCVRDTYQAHSSVLHEHDYLEIAVIRLGYGEHIIHGDDGRELKSSVIKGDVFTILDGERHYYRMCENFRVYNICVGWSYIERFRRELEPLRYFADFLAPNREFGINMLHLPPVVFSDAEAVIVKLRQALAAPVPSRNLAVQIAFLELLYTLFENGTSGLKRSPYCLDDRLFKSIAAMEEHPEQRFSVAKAARESSMSVSGFAHKFKDAVGVPPTEYCILLRLEKCKQLLERSDRSIEEIAITGGFCDGNYMGRLFRRRYGMTPHDYRKIFRGA